MNIFEHALPIFKTVFLYTHKVDKDFYSYQTISKLGIFWCVPLTFLLMSWKKSCHPKDDY